MIEPRSLFFSLKAQTFKLNFSIFSYKLYTIDSDNIIEAGEPNFHVKKRHPKIRH